MPPPLLALPGSSEFRRKLHMVVQAGPISPLFGAVLFAGNRRELEELVRRHPSSPAVVDAAVLPESASHPLLASAVRLGADAPLGVIVRSVLPGIDPEQPRRLQARIQKCAAPETCRILAQVLARSFWPSGRARCGPNRIWLQEYDGSSSPLGYGAWWRTAKMDERPRHRFTRVVFPPEFVPLRFPETQVMGTVANSAASVTTASAVRMCFSSVLLSSGFSQSSGRPTAGRTPTART